MKFPNWFRGSVLCCLSIIGGLSAHAALIYSTSDRLYIDGEIQAGDLDYLIEEAKIWTARDQELVISLNSTGGDVQEAIKIADFVSEVWAYTEISSFRSGEETVCDSACLLIFLAGRARAYYDTKTYVNGEVTSVFYPLGLHRPFFSPEFNRQLSPNEAKAAYKELEELYRAKLYEFGASDAFVQRVFRTPSHRIDRISSDDFYQVFPKEPPWLDEYKAARCGEWTDKDREYLFSDNPELNTYQKREDIMECHSQMFITNQREVMAKFSAN